MVRAMVRCLLYNYGYTSGLYKKATGTVIEQAKPFRADWVG